MREGEGSGLDGGRELAGDGEDLDAANNIISPEYFKTMGIPLIAGRDFNDQDRFNGGDPNTMPTVCIVNRNFAEYFFGKESPLGHYAHNVFHERSTFQIVGVVENSTYKTPREDSQRQIYFAEYEAPVSLQATFYVRAASSEPSG